jgi:hypothetical protein
LQPIHDAASLTTPRGTTLRKNMKSAPHLIPTDIPET